MYALIFRAAGAAHQTARRARLGGIAAGRVVSSACREEAIDTIRAATAKSR